ncbi:integrase catalytic domain-containing protein [Trichonephila clavipes]|nr:integrase catalytic domain-containing protein [Trichonephila clavipes]
MEPNLQVQQNSLFSAEGESKIVASFTALLPHFGGLWEASIKSMKRILLRRLLKEIAIMNFEELTTLMAQIEAVLNSRPLPPLSSDPNDLNPLTPGHFLTNCAISSFPESYTASGFFVLSLQVDTHSNP